MIDGDLLTMSALEAALTISRFRRVNPTYDSQQLVQAIQAVRSDFCHNDYEMGLTLEREVGSLGEALEDIPFFRASVEAVIRTTKPIWTRLAPGGREQVLRGLSLNGAQCLRNAGLLETPPSRETTEWWDALAASVRSERDAQLLLQGRDAERASLDYENDRLEKLGIRQKARWVSIEDNAAGYDILSYDSAIPDPTNRLIEVKSTSQTPPTIVISRTEWNAALKFGGTYVFHIWTLPAKKLTEITPADLAAHIPSNNGDGAWLKAELRVDRLLDKANV